MNTYDSYLELSIPFHSENIVIDGLTWFYEGPFEFFDPETVTATNTTVCPAGTAADHDFSEAVLDVAKARHTIRRENHTTLIETSNDIKRAKENGKVGIIMGFQHSKLYDKDESRVGLFYDQGVRISQLTYNYRTFTGDGCLEPNDGGLSLVGKRLIKMMNSVGMLLDLSHGGEITTLDAMKVSRNPAIFSHSNPKALTENPRNISDQQIKELAKLGGVIGCCTWAPLCCKNIKGRQPSVDDFLDHIDYVVDLVGIEHVGISSDSPCKNDKEYSIKHEEEFETHNPGILTPYLKDVCEGSQVVFQEKQQPKGIPGIQDMRAVTGGLFERGYKKEDIVKILGGNFLRVFEEVWR